MGFVVTRGALATKNIFSISLIIKIVPPVHCFEQPWQRCSFDGAEEERLPNFR